MHVKGWPLLIMFAEDQFLLQQTGGMTDRQMLAVNKLLIKLSGFLIHNRKNTLAALTDGFEAQSFCSIILPHKVE
jgi:hypothetical protein